MSNNTTVQPAQDAAHVSLDEVESRWPRLFAKLCRMYRDSHAMHFLRDIANKQANDTDLRVVRGIIQTRHQL